MNKALQQFKTGNLSEAIKTLNEQLKKDPTDIDSRSILMEMLCFNAEFERADKQLDLIAHQSPELAMTSSLLRLTLKGAQARADFFEQGVLPEFFDKDEELEKQLSAVIDVKQLDYENATRTVNQIIESNLTLPLCYNDSNISELRDLDDLVGRYFEVIGGNGKYYWIHMSQIQELEFKAPVDRLDLLWRRAEILLKNGMKGEVKIPVCYYSSNGDASKLGKITEWERLSESLVRGIGQKTYLVGEEAIAIMDMTKLSAAA